ncbi:glycosyltransferase [Paenibacillus sp. PR3]|uniref:Glycosyltransferase n=2 Tax=Paenibacillus terricola TaxID=2763503 RepID=A0ABR8MZS0_9BACL|nr:glycosyltransferase [Paenibacillus terricola]
MTFTAAALIAASIAPSISNAAVKSEGMKVSMQLAPTADARQQVLTQSAVQFSKEMRRLWIEHILWTGSYIVSAISGLEDQQQVLSRLLRNQQDIGNLFKPYYGDAVGNQLTTLLQQHIMLAGKVVDAAKAGNTADLNKYNAEWHKNADDIARFLAAANPSWGFKWLQDMLYTHLKLITDQVVARLKKDWEGDIHAIDQNEAHMLQFADVLSDGIVKQFPKQFQQ